MTSPLSPEAVAQMVADLATKSAMINMGEKIAWGSDSGVMDAAADMLTTLAAENATLLAERDEALRLLDNSRSSFKPLLCAMKQRRFSPSVQMIWFHTGPSKCHGPGVPASRSATICATASGDRGDVICGPPILSAVLGCHSENLHRQRLADPTSDGMARQDKLHRAGSLPRRYQYQSARH